MTPDEGKDTATRREVLKGDAEAAPAARTPRHETTPRDESAPRTGTTSMTEAEKTEAEKTEAEKTGISGTGAERTGAERTDGAAVRGDERNRGRAATDTLRDTPDRAAGAGERGTAARTPFPSPTQQTVAPSGATADDHRETPDRAASTTGEHGVTPRTPVPLGSREATTSREEATSARGSKGSRGTGTPAAGRAADGSGESARTGAHDPGTARGNGVSGADDSALLSHDACDKYALRMRHAVGGFVDGPRASVEEADHVLEELTAQFTDAMARRRRTLRTSWEKAGADEASDTEQLRLALRDYREVTERLLHL
ncbi:prolipoprotein diacylglyceryl transferase [Streptomyces fagopyri]|uniref:hypothetical protein n=1 Tax=Streptomyces fagopyri TaxID=2662397 RepID=UPI003806820D